jgi:hypothetical protein
MSAWNKVKIVVISRHKIYMNKIKEYSPVKWIYKKAGCYVKKIRNLKETLELVVCEGPFLLWDVYRMCYQFVSLFWMWGFRSTVVLGSYIRRFRCELTEGNCATPVVFLVL